MPAPPVLPHALVFDAVCVACRIPIDASAVCPFCFVRSYNSAPTVPADPGVVYACRGCSSAASEPDTCPDCPRPPAVGRGA